MPGSINRISNCFGDPLKYVPVPSLDLEQRLKPFVGKYIIVVYTHYNAAGSQQHVTGGVLQSFRCEDGDNQTFNKVKISFAKEPHITLALKLIDGHGYNMASDISGVINWAGPLDAYNRLNKKGYFRELKAEQAAH